jgi:hypothetical protein
MGRERGGDDHEGNPKMPEMPRASTGADESASAYA